MTPDDQQDPRRGSGPGQALRIYRFGEWTFNSRWVQLSRGDDVADVEPKALNLLQVLIEERGRLVSKEELLERVWDGAYVSDNALTRAAARLRNALGDQARSPRFVQTVHGKGYRFIAEVAERPACESAHSPTTESPQAAVNSPVPLSPLAAELPLASESPPAPEDLPTPSPRPVLRSRPAVALLLAALASIGLIGFLVWPDPQSSPTVSKLDDRRIAVLPLRHIGPNEKYAYLAEGLSEQLVSVLAQIDGLRVVARASTRALKKQTAGAGAIGNDLGAGSILEGSVRTGDATMRIALRLIDANTEEILWSREFDAEVADLFVVQVEVAVQVAEALETEIESSQLAQLNQLATTEASAYELYLRGRQAYRRHTLKGNEEAIQRFEQALVIDPSFALAEAGLANAYAMRVIRWDFPIEWRQRAEEAAQRALALNPDLPQAFKALAMVAFSRARLSESLRLNLEALKRDPDFDEAIYNAASMASALGHWDVALELQSRDLGRMGRSGLPLYLFQIGFEAAGWAVAERVLAEQPLAGFTQLNLAYFSMVRGDHEDARVRLKKMTAASPEWSRAWRQLGEVEIWAGNLDAALPHLEEVLDRSNSPYPKVSVRLAWLLAEQGREDEAEVHLEAAEVWAQEQIESDNESWDPLWVLAAVASVRHQDEDAIAWLNKAFASGFNHVRMHRTDPQFRRLHQTPEYRALGDRMDRELAKMRQVSLPIVEGLGLPAD
ncbi:MAG: winged helix-turn-helix domain-containing protein [Thermoanaerobaculia bacterium]|nr:winged helix-turn-helix domain-containing protein [Thermoanaerobaculia bacterium]